MRHALYTVLTLTHTHTHPATPRTRAWRPQEEQRDSTKHDMIFHWVVFVSGFIVAVAGGVSKTIDTLQWGCGPRPCAPPFPRPPASCTPAPLHPLAPPCTPSCRWDNTVLANISVAWVIINMVPFGMALGYAYLPHNKNVHGLLVSLSWTVYAMCAICTRACASRLQPSARGLGGAAASRPAPNLAPPPLPPFTLHALYMPPPGCAGACSSVWAP